MRSMRTRLACDEAHGSSKRTPSAWPCVCAPVQVGFGGKVEKKKENGKEVSVWKPSEEVRGLLGGGV